MVHEELGAFLRSLRNRKGLGLRQAAALAKDRFPALTKGAIENIEQGLTRHIDSNIFKGMSVIYGIPYEDLIHRYVRAEYGVSARDLIDHARRVESPPNHLGVGGVSVASRHRVEQVLREELAFYKALVRRAHRLTKSAYTALGGEGGPSRQPPSKSRRTA